MTTHLLGVDGVIRHHVTARVSAGGADQLADGHTVAEGHEGVVGPQDGVARVGRTDIAHQLQKNGR